MDALISGACFKGRVLPEKSGLVVGYARLIHRYNLTVPFPEKLSFISQHHRRYQTDEWVVLTPRHEPDESLPGDLTFALRYEGVHLAILKDLFHIINPEILARWIRLEPTGRYSRRIWFLYEWLTGQLLDVPDVVMGNYVEAVDPKRQQVSTSPSSSRRHRVKNNLPEIVGCAPLNQSTQNLEDLSSNTLTFESYDRLKAALKETFQIPDHKLDQFIEILSQRFKRNETF